MITDCISNLNREDLKYRFEKSINDLCVLSDQYHELAEKKQLHTMKTHDIYSYLCKKELIDLYDHKLARKGQPGRKYYDNLMMATELCPYCSIRETGQIDHVLPKFDYPGLSITPSNLVPVCKACNDKKGFPKIRQATDLHMHPYYDKEIAQVCWLDSNIKLVDHDALLITYSVVRPDHWSDELYRRLLNHFETFELNKLYSFQGNDYINSEKYTWSEFKRRLGKDKLIDFLKQLYSSFSADYGLNHWKTSAIRSLSVNTWFIDSCL